MIIGVAGIPRNALVEVEIVAFKENNLPNSKIKYEQISSSTMDTTVSTVDHIRRQVDKWPFWKDLQETTPQRYDADSGIALEMIDDAIDNNNQTISVVNNEIKSSVDTDSVNNSCMFVDMRLKKYEQCFCTGIVWLSAANTINTGSAEAPTYNSLVSCLNLLRLIRSVIQQNGLLSINNMLTIKFYVDQHDKQIASVVHEALSVVFMTYSIPLIIIPMVSIDTTVKLIAHFFCCDLHSIDTEHWVYNK